MKALLTSGICQSCTRAGVAGLVLQGRFALRFLSEGVSAACAQSKVGFDFSHHGLEFPIEFPIFPLSIPKLHFCL